MLVTGIAGYVGSHAAAALAHSGYEVVGIDNFENSTAASIERLTSLIGGFAFVEADVQNTDRVADTLRDHKVDAVLHFAGRKSVAESVSDPLGYFRTNVAGSISVLQAMARVDLHHFVFSSSCTVYGNGDGPTDDRGARSMAETDAVAPCNPYGRSKAMVESILDDAALAGLVSSISLRYFNPIGAHPSHQIGEDPKNPPANLLPHVMERALHGGEPLKVYGDNYNTIDGTCIRDYVHVSDLAHAHVAALESLGNEPGHRAVNIGTGTGHSVLEVIDAVERVTGRTIPYDIVDPRPGDAAALYANPELALERLSWKAEADLDQMCDDHWQWHHSRS